MVHLKQIKTIVIDLVSFGTPKARLFNLASILFIFRFLPEKYLLELPLKCVFKNLLLPLIFLGNCPTKGIFLGCNCPACGLGHALSRLLHGDIITAWTTNKLVMPLMVVMIYLIIFNLVLIIKKYRKK